MGSHYTQVSFLLKNMGSYYTGKFFIKKIWGLNIHRQVFYKKNMGSHYTQFEKFKNMLFRDHLHYTQVNLSGGVKIHAF